MPLALSGMSRQANVDEALLPSYIRLTGSYALQLHTTQREKVL